MNQPVVLLTGFEPYGGRSLNPSAEVARRLDGAKVAGVASSATIAARIMPVAFAGLGERIEALVRELNPSLVVSLGLAPGEPTIRLERVGLNLADYQIPDNAGAFLKDAPVATDGRVGLFATLPLRRIEQRLLESGIPATLSTTAGTFLCNATLYTFLRVLQETGSQAPCGFVHLPYLPDQVAGTLLQRHRERASEAVTRTELPSMHLDTMTEAVRLLLEASLDS
jgi:pyroglutamyl-peptidase